jgi:microcompartment protein CcmK/EutM
MYLGRIIGTIEARMRLPGFEPQRLVVVQPLDFNEQPIRWTTIAADITGASVGSLITFEEGREAANPFDPPLPVDACVVAVVDSFNYQP